MEVVLERSLTDSVVAMTKSTLLQDPAVSREQLREQIRQTVIDAQAAAQAAAQEAAKAAQEAAKADREVRVLQPPVPVGTPTVGVQQFDPEDMIPPQAESISIAFFAMLAVIFTGYPLMRAIGRRIERGAPAPAQISPEVRDQLQHISQSVEAIAIEVERISEAQRFTTKMLADRQREATGLSSGQQ